MTGLMGFAARHRLALQTAAALAGLVLAGCVLGVLVTVLLEATGLIKWAVLVWTLVTA